MNTKSYNTRTLAACAKRLRYLNETATEQPQGAIVWRFTEGFRLQIDGEEHEPGGCQWMDLTDWDNRSRLADVEQVLAKDQADQDAYDCLDALLECAPDEFTDAELQHLSLSHGTPQHIQERAFLTLCARNMAKHPDIKRRSIA